jgi:excisionase family DNA binding protein
MNKELFSTSDIAKLLGISRIAVFKRIKAGKIKAKKVGRNFVIRKEELPEILGDALTESKKYAIETAVKRTVREYGETLKLLGRE